MSGESSSFVSVLTTKLWSSNFIKLDVCGRPLFANWVTYMVTICKLICVPQNVKLLHGQVQKKNWVSIWLQLHTV